MIETRISGIPCLIEVTVFSHYAGRDTWGSDWDYNGGTEVEFEVCDRRGRPAPWLERKMTNKDYDRIVGEIIDSSQKSRYF
jgi:hypothetical protein